MLPTPQVRRPVPVAVRQHVESIEAAAHCQLDQAATNQLLAQPMADVSTAGIVVRWH